MHVVLAWFATRPLGSDARRAMSERFEASIRGLVPDSYLRNELGGDDWGVTMLHPGRIKSARWEPVETAGGITALSLGIPVGVPRRETPVGMARRLLAGESVHRDLLPPFGLIALDQAGEFAAQQDWLGMCRLFAGEADGITVLCTRPSTLAAVLRVGQADDGQFFYQRRLSV